jgi:uncharacterized membrane protein YGL010W
MKSVGAWLDEYSTNHRNSVNQKFHFACIPPIVFSVICGLKSIPIGTLWANAATVILIAALLYYWILSWRLAAGVLLMFSAFYAGALGLQSATGSNFIWVALAIFVVGWIGQFIGHHVEGARPSFFKDVQFLLIGPIWELAHLYRILGIPLDSQAGPAAVKC